MDYPEFPLHPEPRSFAWSKLEIACIENYAKACVDADRAQRAAPGVQGGSARQFVEWIKAQPEDREPSTLLETLAEFEAAQPPQQSEPPEGLPFGIIDPDYAKVFTIARIIAWQYGFALVMHGSFTRDLDLLLVPWEKHACTDGAERVVAMIAADCGLTINGEPGVKPHGRLAYTLLFPGFGDPRWVDLSVMPLAAAPTTPKDAS